LTQEDHHQKYWKPSRKFMKQILLFLRALKTSF
jgi:hypothetical protein